MANSEENRASLESFLDNTTINFHRFIEHAIHQFDNAALAATSVARGVFPLTKEGISTGYGGYFGFRTERQSIILLEVQNMVHVGSHLFLKGYESGRGHKIRYVTDPMSVDDTPMDYSLPKLVAKLPDNCDIPITNQERVLLQNDLRGIKRSEYGTIREKIASEGRAQGPLAPREFTQIVDNTFSQRPVPPAVANIDTKTYFVAVQPHSEKDKLIVSEHADGKGNRYEVLAKHINLHLAQRFPVGSKINVELATIQTLDQTPVTALHKINSGNLLVYANKDII
ncbi:hypothetical protein H8D36_04220 [archaeon]|nr:hypothetical protein [archaeon]MBL7056940.1 hypothetical protein [Candidatus Woesearchaeota archaeon]